MSRYGQCSDEELIERLRNGESEISDYLMEKYKGTVKKRARAMYLIGGETDDLIQEGMIGLFKAVQDYRPDREASFRTFAGLCIDRQLYSAVKNSTRQKHIPLNSYVSLSEEEESGSLEGLWSENPEALVIDRENTGILEKEISKALSPMENKVLDYYLRGTVMCRSQRSWAKHPNPLIMLCSGSGERSEPVLRNFKYNINLSFTDKK